MCLTTLRSASDTLTYNVLCGIPGMQKLVVSNLAALGFRQCHHATTLLLVDMPRGFALEQLPTLDHTRHHVIVTTINTCPEYWQDLADYHPAILLVGTDLERPMVDAIVHTQRGERYQLVPGPPTKLRSTERAILRLLVRGWTNEEIAQELHISEKRVRNLLVNVYGELGVRDRIGAALRYWGCDDLLKLPSTRKRDKCPPKSGQ